MDVETVNGKTREEWLAHFIDAGEDESEARFFVAITFGDIEGDCIRTGEDPDPDEDEDDDDGEQNDNIIRSLVLTNDLDAAYKELALDETREDEAADWAEALISDTG